MARFLDTTGFRYRVQPCAQGDENIERAQFVIYRLWGIILLQCDQLPEKHCSARDEAARVRDAFAAQVRRGHFDKIRLIRFNSGAYTENGIKAKTRMKDRYDALCLAILEEPQKHFSIKYMFYSRSSHLPEVCWHREYPHELRDIVEREEPPQRGQKRSAADASL